MISAIVPVAFFTDEHVAMTYHMLNRLLDEVQDVTVYDNGGPLQSKARAVLVGLELLGDLHITEAKGWPFYRMWNEGIAAAPDVCLVLNNDIEWDTGALAALGEYLEKADDDVAIVSPSPNGEPRHAFAIRSHLAHPIDERYQTWYGDTELEQLVKRAGHRLEHFDPGIRHPHIQTTTDHLAGVQAMRQADRALYESRWGAS